jgi:hypothetical protein
VLYKQLVSKSIDFAEKTRNVNGLAFLIINGKGWQAGVSAGSWYFGLLHGIKPTAPRT